MPGWAQWIIGAAAVTTAVGILWAKVIRPLARLVVIIEKLVDAERRRLDEQDRDS